MMMSNILLTKYKTCFGQNENGDNSWHCKGCPIIEECETKKKENKTMNTPKVEDVVHEPNHYKHGSFEVIDEMVIVFGIENTIQFCRMNAWKYRARAPFKGNMEQDMAKANCYLEMAADLEAIRDKNFELLKEGKLNET